MIARLAQRGRAKNLLILERHEIDVARSIIYIEKYVWKTRVDTDASLIAGEGIVMESSDNISSYDFLFF